MSTDTQPLMSAAEIKARRNWARSHKFDGLPRPKRYVRIKTRLGDHWVIGPPRLGSKYVPHQGKREMERRVKQRDHR